MSDEASPISLQLSSQVENVKAALKQIKSSKKSVQDNATEATYQINTAVSRLTEDIRRREVWLCEQVQLLQATKQEILDEQSAELFQELGRLESYQNCVSLLEQSLPEYSESCLNHNEAVNHLLTRVESLELDPLEDPCISFKGNIQAARNILQKFGSIESEEQDKTEPEKDTMHASRCLPSHFDEYEDDQHHFMYKPLQTTPNFTMSMRVPKPNVRAEDWLFLPQDVQPPPEPTQPATRAVDVSRWLAERKLNASPSTHQWLNELQNQCSVEEETYAERSGETSTVSVASDIEVLSHSDFSQFEEFDARQQETDVADTSSNMAATSGVCRYFDHVLSQPNSEWLLEGNLSTINCPYLKMKYFAEISSNLKDWLKQFGEDNKEDKDKDSCEAKCGVVPNLTSYSGTSAFTGAQVDIENLHELASCVQTPTPSPKSAKRSARHQPISSQKPYSWVLTQVADVCKANELCESFSECVSPEHCCSEAVKQPSTVLTGEKNREHLSTIQKWLHDTAAATERPEVKNVRRGSSPVKRRKSVYNEWLYTPPSPAESGYSSQGQQLSGAKKQKHGATGSERKQEKYFDSVISSFFTESGCNSANWLSQNPNPVHEKSAEQSSFIKKSDISEWLSEAVKSCSSENIQKESNCSLWLKKQSPKEVKSVSYTKEADNNWLKNEKFDSEKFMMFKDKSVEIPEYADDVAWLLSDKLNIKAKPEGFTLCGKIPAYKSKNIELDTWLKN